VKCNIHGWTQAYIGVVDNPYFTVFGEDGSYRIGNLPPGTYTQTEASVDRQGRDMARKTGNAGATGKGGSAFEHAGGRYV